MKIIKQTQSKLIFRNWSPLRAWTTWILGFLLSSIALTYLISRIAVVGGATTFTCRRLPEKTISCQLKKYQFPLSWKITEIHPGDLQNARLDRVSNRHRTVFVTRSGEIALSEFSFSEESQEKKVDRVNNFIRDGKQKSVTVRDREDGLKPFVWFVFDIAWLSAGIAFMHSRQIQAQFDRTLNSFTLKQTNSFGTKFFEYPLAEIAGIVLEEGTPDEADTSYNIFMVMASGDRLLLSHGCNISNNQRKTIANLREYLNIQ